MKIGGLCQNVTIKKLGRLNRRQFKPPSGRGLAMGAAARPLSFLCIVCRWHFFDGVISIQHSGLMK